MPNAPPVPPPATATTRHARRTAHRGRAARGPAPRRAALHALLAALLALAPAACDGEQGSDGAGGPTSGASRTPAAPLTAESVWTVDVEGAGSSSPRVLDANGDGVLDVVVGSGKESQFGAASVLDGRTGAPLWRETFEDEVYATACLMQIDGDGVPDVVLGRRRLMGGLNAMSGRDGERLWGLLPSNPEHAFPPLHFNTAVPCHDLDGDGVGDLIALQGGGDDVSRPTSHLYLVSGATGALLRDVPTPDGAESYCVPALERVGDGWRLIVGTGGETLPGHLYALSFPGLEVLWSLESPGRKGFVGAPVLHDFEGTGRRDVIVSGFNGTLLRVHGETGEILWKRPHRGFETYSTPALGRFDDDEVLDVVAVFSEGRWPEYDTRAVIQWFDGRDGELLDERDWGVMCMSSPVIVDFDADGRDEVVLCTNLSYAINRRALTSRLEVFDGRDGRASRLQLDLPGFAAATPWIGDLDADGRLDLLLVHWEHVTRLALGPTPGARVRWDQYRGARQDGVQERGAGP